jgi:hypothetical protein
VPVVGCVCVGVAETVLETDSLSFYFTKDTFNAVSISMSFVSEIETVTSAGFVQWCRTIDEKHGVIDVVFLAQFVEERVCESVVSCRFTLCME